MTMLKETPTDSFTMSTDFIYVHIRVDDGFCTLVGLNGHEWAVGHVPDSAEIHFFARHCG